MASLSVVPGSVLSSGRQADLTVVMLAAATTEAWQASLLNRLEMALVIVAALLIGALVCLLLYRLWTVAVGRDRHHVRTRTHARPSARVADPDLKVIIDLTDQHLEVMRQRREGSGLG